MADMVSTGSTSEGRSTSEDSQTAVRYERDAEGIVTLTLDDPTASANTMTELYRDSMSAAVRRLDDEVDDVTGVIVASAKKTFFAGANLGLMLQTKPEDAPSLFANIEATKRDLRRLETYPRPVVAAINGAALGGGFEIALACNHRIVVDDPSALVGLPEATLGLLPGGGGVTRIVRMLGLQAGLMDVLLQGARFKRQAGDHVQPYTYDDIKTIADHVHWVGRQGPHAGNSRSAAAGGGHAHAGAQGKRAARDLQATDTTRPR